MSAYDDYLAHMERARREADHATDPDIKGLWRKIADGWAKLLQEKVAENIQRQRRALGPAPYQAGGPLRTHGAEQ